MHTISGYRLCGRLVWRARPGSRPCDIDSRTRTCLAPLRRPAPGITARLHCRQDTARGSRQTVPVMEPPETKYMTIGDADVAYQVMGEGPRDVLFCNSLGGHVDHLWQIPPAAKFLSEVGAFCRLLHMDRRGSGASDAVPLSAIPTWEALAERHDPCARRRRCQADGHRGGE